MSKGTSDPGDGTARDGTLPLETDADARHVLVRRFRLEAIEGPDRGKTYASTGERTVIGTDESADFVLTDPTVSRFHCEIVLSGGRAQVRDLGSRNGTAIDRVPVLSAPLLSSGSLTLGKSRLGFDLGSEVVKVPLSMRQSFGILVGVSPAMRRVYALLEKAAASEVTVLIEGETGTGKEAVAESIHRESARASGPFVVVDCGAIPANILESELFGHERGAFTGASSAREGAFEAAAGGTIFLDEIGELGSELQPKLLRVLERRTVKRVGANRYQPIDIRVLAATNRNLRTEVNARRFRSDLYFRLAVLEVRLPALREHSEDIPVLVEHLLAGIGRGRDPGVAFARTPAFQAELARHAWPGNVRELRNYLERCVALQAPTPIARGEAEPAIEALLDLSRPLKEVRDGAARRIEGRYVEEIMRKHADNVTAAARAAGIDRIHFYRLLARHGLR